MNFVALQRLAGFAEACMAKREQISVPIDPELRAFAEEQAAREDRPVSSWIRHLVAEARRQARNGQKKRSKKPHPSLPLEHVQREDASDGRLGCGLAFALHPLLTGDLTLAG
jgi:hypothetical protein